MTTEFNVIRDFLRSKKTGETFVTEDLFKAIEDEGYTFNSRELTHAFRPISRKCYIIALRNKYLRTHFIEKSSVGFTIVKIPPADLSPSRLAEIYYNV